MGSCLSGGIVVAICIHLAVTKRSHAGGALAGIEVAADYCRTISSDLIDPRLEEAYLTAVLTGTKSN